MLKYLSIGLFLVSTAASAEPIDLSHFLTDVNGQKVVGSCKTKIENGKCSDPAYITLGDMVIAALNGSMGDTETQKLNYMLLRAVVDKTKIDLSAEDRVRLVKALWDWRASAEQRHIDLPLYPVGQAVCLIDPAEKSCQ